ncbi:MAG: hypothetical protein WCP97_01365 [bacterium]
MLKKNIIGIFLVLLGVAITLTTQQILAIKGITLELPFAKPTPTATVESTATPLPFTPTPLATLVTTRDKPIQMEKIDWEGNPSAQRNFRGTMLIVSGKDSQGRDMVFQAELNRKQEADKGGYLHYYWFHGLVAGEHISKSQNSYRDKVAITTGELVSQYDTYIASDFSSREKIEATFLLNEGKKLSLHVQGFQGDFIIKNTPEYTEYVDLGTATVDYGGETIPARACLFSIASMDYSVALFPFREGKEIATVHEFWLWDDEGDFYVIGKGIVNNPVPRRASHELSLYREEATGKREKGFQVGLDFSQQQGKINWNIALPDLHGDTFTLEAANPITANQDRGLVRGVLKKKAGAETKTVQGFYVFIQSQ